MRTRREMKADAKKTLKRHYFLFLLLCLVISLLGGELVMSGTAGEDMMEDMTPQTRITFTDAIVTSFTDFVMDVAEGKREEREQQIRETQERYIEESRREEIFGRSRGVLASVVNKLSSGAYLMTLLVGLRSLVGTDEVAVALLLLGALALMCLFQIFLVGVSRTVAIRLFLEGRCYEKVPGQRIWFLLRVKKWCHVAMANLVRSLLLFLWGLTVIGGIVKSYSYRLVPYILAENPSVKALDAITLSTPRSLAPYLWNGQRHDAAVAEPFPAKARAGIRPGHGPVRLCGVFYLRLPGICPWRHQMVGLYGILPEPERPDLRGGAAGLRHRRHGHRVCAGTLSGRTVPQSALQDIDCGRGDSAGALRS